ncbi:MAG TPA: hypothetical protein VNU65_09015 [Xanthobacteraceae bacterium]|nr:hypothetical protein [Xanthobacteraceae bacterium]
MRNFLRSIVTVAVVAVLGASASIAFAAARPNTAYDGVWSVMIYTQAGDCPQSLRYSVRIAGGRVLSDDQAYQVAGTVAPNGETRVVVAEHDRSASGVGRLSGNQGQGRWRTSTGECVGQWTAERRQYNY